MCKLTQQDILDFEQATVNLKKAKKIESELRKKIIKSFRYGDKIEGVVHKSIDDMDVDIEITLKLGRTLDVDALNTVWADLTQDQKDTIVQKPSLLVKEYKALCDNNDQGELVNIVIEKPGLATVKLNYDE